MRPTPKPWFAKPWQVTAAGLGRNAVLGHVGGMSRTAIAVPLGLLVFALYLGAVVALADHVLELHWALQVPYFLVAGIGWAFPAKSLFVWAANGQGRGPGRTAR